MWASAFNEDDPLAPKVADEMGIVMGTSHHEPMMRAPKEYTRRRDEVGPWDYASNPGRIEKFFAEGIEKSKDYHHRHARRRRCGDGRGQRRRQHADSAQGDRRTVAHHRHGSWQEGERGAAAVGHLHRGAALLRRRLHRARRRDAALLRQQLGLHQAHGRRARTRTHGWHGPLLPHRHERRAVERPLGQHHHRAQTARAALPDLQVGHRPHLDRQRGRPQAQGSAHQFHHGLCVEPRRHRPRRRAGLARRLHSQHLWR